MSRTLTGSCECGAVEYRVADEFLYSLNCHCSNCRAHTGSAFKPFAGSEGAKLEIVTGADNLLIWGDPDGKNHTRCGTCGSPLYSTVEEGTNRRCSRRGTSSSGRRRRGSRSPTTFHNARS